MQQNLLEETVQYLKEFDKTPSDVLYVTDFKSYCTWEDFARQAAAVNYNSSFGLQEISPNLTIVGDDWFIERQEYDGSEWWQFYGPLQKPDIYNPSIELLRNKTTLNRYW